MPIVHLTSAASPDEVAAAVGRDGAAVVDGVAPAPLLDRIESELRPYLDATPTGPDDFSGDRTRRTGSLIARSPGCRELVMHPLALGAARTFLTHGEEDAMQAFASRLGKTQVEMPAVNQSFDL